MSITLEIYELRDLLRDANELGAVQALVSAGIVPEFISQRESYRLYGKGVVDRWVKEGLIRRHKDGNNTSKIRYSKIELETLAKSNNRLTYLTTNERKII